MKAEAASMIDTQTAINSLYMLYCTSLLPLVIIGIALFYSGLTQRRSSLTMLALPVWLIPFVLIDWFIWSYSLCYSSSSNNFIGGLNFVVLRQLRESISLLYSTPRGDILSLIHFLFNGLMKMICVALTFPGCIAERGRILPMLVFLFFWSCIIYNPVTYWFWNRNGWLSIEMNKLPVLDFAGGNCIHIVSGFTALAYSYILGPRNPKILYNYRNTNTGHIVIGTFLMTCGWCGFIGGCEYIFSILSIFIFVNTLLCACVSGIVWTIIDYYFSAIPLEGSTNHSQSKSDGKLKSSSSNNLEPIISATGVLINQHYHDTKSNLIERRKISMISFSSGVMTGLVVITPGGGYVSSHTEFWKSFVFGVVGAIICNLSTRLKYFFNIDDALDLFAIHGVAGIVGSLLTGIFSNQRYGSSGGWVYGHWIQFAYQLLGSVVTSAYVFIVSCFFLYIIDFIPGLHLRIDKDFNRRLRKQKREKSSSSSNSLDMEPQLTPTAVQGVDMNPVHKDVNSSERAELLGSDCYEFNGEYSLDFMEFIKVLKPQDYPDDELDYDTINYESQLDNTQGLGFDYEMHHSDSNNLIKRE